MCGVGVELGKGRTMMVSFQDCVCEWLYESACARADSQAWRMVRVGWWMGGGETYIRGYLLQPGLRDGLGVVSLLSAEGVGCIVLRLPW